MAAPMERHQNNDSYSEKIPSCISFADFHVTVNSSLGKKVSRSSCGIFVDISVVLLGVKPGFLFDYCCIDEPCTLIPMCQMVAAILHTRTTSCRCHCENTAPCSVLKALQDCFKIYVVVNDIFIVNVEIVTELFRNFPEYPLDEGLCMPRVLITDASYALSEPKIADEEVHSQLKKMVDSIYKTHLNSRCASVPVDTIEIDNEWCIPSLFGLFIGYPLVYWLNASDGRNCLSCVPLTVYKVVCTTTLEHLQDGPQTPHFSQQNLNREHTVFSFSIPSNVEIHCKPLITKWFSKLQDTWQRNVPKCLLKDLRLEMTNVVLSSVAL